ncbi:MAG: response regulator transcription factor [Alphaproteobacteria bacterium]
MKVLIADDHPLVRSGMRAVLNDFDPDMVVVEAVDFPQVLARVEQHPDLTLVLLDLNMPGSERFSGVAALVERCPTVPVVVLAGSEDPADVRGALDRGAAGYIPKSSSTAVILTALRLVLAGGVYVPPAALHAGAAESPPAPPPPAHDLLTERQVEVLALMRQGKSNKEIARALGIAESTVKAHVSVILKALNVTSRAKAVVAIT